MKSFSSEDHTTIMQFSVMDTYVIYRTEWFACFAFIYLCFHTYAMIEIVLSKYPISE